MPAEIARIPTTIGSAAVRVTSGGSASQNASAPRMIPTTPTVRGCVHSIPPMRVVIAVMRHACGA